MDIGRGHRLALTSRLIMLDEALCEFERWAQGHAAKSVLYEERDNLTPAQRQTILEQVSEARRALERTREAFGLEKQTQNVRRAIAGHCAVLWELLTELEPKYLSHYGTLEEEAAAQVAQDVAELRGCLGAIAEAATAPLR